MNDVAAARRKLERNLQRDVHCVFGLPVDNLTMASTKALLRERITQDGNTVLATINMNWLAESFSNPEFRFAILNSDLVVLDGKPLLWLAQLLGCPMRETVPGSTLIQELLEEPTDQPMTIFLFGGEGDAAQRAMQRINARHEGGLRAVGSLNPGFGTVEEMSSDNLIETINAAKPDILLVALGAKKGTQWIERNRNRLNAKIISHLGATVNFLAGTIKRAPRFMQTLGVEWVWRIAQEPKLFARYAADGLTLLRFVIPRLLLWWQYRRQCRKLQSRLGETAPVSTLEQPNSLVLAFGYCLERQQVRCIREILTKHDYVNKRIVLDFQQTEFADSTFWATLLLLQWWPSNNVGDNILLTNWNSSMIRWSRLFCFLPEERSENPGL